MAKKIRMSEPTLPSVRDTSTPLPRLDAKDIQRALGGDATGQRLEELLAPITLLAVREELSRRLQSTGGRPALSGVTRRVKVPLRDEEWRRLQQIACAMSHEGRTPSAGQVASTILTTILTSRAVHFLSDDGGIYLRIELSDDGRICADLPLPHPRSLHTIYCSKALADSDQTSRRKKTRKPLKT